MHRLVMLLAALATSAWGCGGAATSSPAPAAPTSSPPAEEEPVTWSSTLHRDHPLAGRLWDVRRGGWIDESSLAEELASSRFVLLGERHDNADHHRLRSRLIEGLVARGRRPALVLEMLDTEQQPRLDEARAAGADPEAIAAAVEWADRWGSWELYRPFVALAIEADLPLVAGNLPRELVRRVAREGVGALGEVLASRLGLDEPLPAEVHAAMAEELASAHCGMLPSHAAEAMVPAQRARDAHLAESLAAAGTDDGAVLIAGNGHVRTDRGSGAILRRRRPDASLVAVGFVEVDEGLDAPERYAERCAAEALPFDVVWFTPGAEREDPCEAMRARMRGHGSGE